MNTTRKGSQPVHKSGNSAPARLPKHRGSYQHSQSSHLFIQNPSQTDSWLHRLTFWKRQTDTWTHEWMDEHMDEHTDTQMRERMDRQMLALLHLVRPASISKGGKDVGMVQLTADEGLQGWCHFRGQRGVCDLQKTQPGSSSDRILFIC